MPCNGTALYAGDVQQVVSEKSVIALMVGHRDIAKRHGVYTVALLSVILFSKYTYFLASVLTGMLLAIRWHHSTTYPFLMLVSFATPLSTGLCVKLSAHTWWYAAPIELLGIPPWLFPMHGLFAHWVLDAYFLATLHDLRKSVLPGADN